MKIMNGAKKTALDRERDNTARARVFARRLEEDLELEASRTDRRDADSLAHRLAAPSGDHVYGLVFR